MANNQVPSVGPTNAKILIVGEAPGREEVQQGEPFVGASGKELTRILADAGIERSECFLANVARQRPPSNDIQKWFTTKAQGQKEGIEPYRGRYAREPIREGLEVLFREIEQVQPNVIIALGNTPLWALCGETKITQWRGSILEGDANGLRVKVVPTYHPAAVLRQWPWRYVAVHDLRKAREERDSPKVPRRERSYAVLPDYDQTMETLGWLLGRLNAGESLRLSVDIEVAQGQISMLGIAWNTVEAICIPFMQGEGSYWELRDELEIVKQLRTLLTHEGARVVGQNFSFDTQHIARQWGFLPNVADDTLIAHHVLFPELPKSLDFLSSLYCHAHSFWKEDRKLHEKLDANLERMSSYNSEDCVRTFEVMENLDPALDKAGLRQVYQWQMELWWPILRMMLRGVRMADTNRRELAEELNQRQQDLREWIGRVTGQDLNPQSPQQLTRYFYEYLRLPVIRNQKSGNPTADVHALKKLGKKEPLVKPLCDALIQHRSIGNIRSNVVEKEPDSDGRMRCSYNLAGTKSFRLSSSENAFGGGLNLQTITDGEKKGLPNLRRLFIPDEGYVIGECDLDRADVQVVAWDSGCETLKDKLKKGIDLHLDNARVLYRLPITQADVEDGEKAAHLAKQYKRERSYAKAFLHGANYGGKARTLAQELGIKVAEAQEGLDRLFGEYPEVLEWQNRIWEQLQDTRTVANPFGYRSFFFDRIEEAWKSALSFLPQSVVGLVVNFGIQNIDRNLPQVQPLLQCHDSTVVQVPADQFPEIEEQVLEQLRVTVPYNDPLIIPVGAKWSRDSWGDCS